MCMYPTLNITFNDEKLGPKEGCYTLVCHFNLLLIALPSVTTYDKEINCDISKCVCWRFIFQYHKCSYMKYTSMFLRSGWGNHMVKNSFIQISKKNSFIVSRCNTSPDRLSSVLRGYVSSWLLTWEERIEVTFKELNLENIGCYKYHGYCCKN